MTNGGCDAADCAVAQFSRILLGSFATLLLFYVYRRVPLDRILAAECRSGTPGASRIGREDFRENRGRFGE
jgi:hypothetical protein